LILVIIAGMFVPFSIGTGTQSSLNAAILMVVLLIGLWIFQMVALRSSGIHHVSASFWPAIALIGSGLLSFGFGQFNWFPTPGASDSAQFGGVMIFVLSAGTFLLVSHHLQHAVTLKWLAFVYVGFVGLYVVANVVDPLGNLVIHFYQRLTNESMFWAWFAAMGFSQAVFNTRLKLPVRVVIGLLVACGLYVAWFQKQGWTSGWFPMVVAIAVTVFIARPKLAVPGGLVIVLLLFINSQIVSSEVMVGDNEYSMVTRLAAWDILFQIIKVSPIFGLGPANYYWYTRLFPIMGYNVVFNSHNNYVDLIAQNGLIGLGVYLWFFWAVGKDIWKNSRRTREGFDRAFLYGCFGGLIATVVAGMLGDWVLPFVYNIGLEGFRSSVLPWMFLGGAIALCRRISAGSAASIEPVIETGAHAA
jgi:O-antigen ligase